MSKVKDKSKQRLHLFYNNNLAQAALLDHPFIINALLHTTTLHLCSTYLCTAIWSLIYFDSGNGMRVQPRGSHLNPNPRTNKHFYEILYIPRFLHFNAFSALFFLFPLPRRSTLLVSDSEWHKTWA